MNSSHSDPDDNYCNICRNYTRPPKYANELAERDKAHARQRALVDGMRALKGVMVCLDQHLDMLASPSEPDHKWAFSIAWDKREAAKAALAAYLAAGGTLEEP